MNESIWKRSPVGSTMSKNLYVLSICMFTGLGVFVSFLVALFTLEMEITWTFLIGVLVLGMAGVIIALKSDKPLVSLAGYMMLVIPYGALLGPFINQFVPVSIIEAFLVTTFYVLVLGIVGAVIPDSLGKWHGWLLSGLIIGLLGYFVIPVAGFFGFAVEQALSLWDWAIIVLFGFIIMYDVNKAMRIAYTLDNAIDTALAIYLDWFNVYVRYLSQRGRRK